MTHDQDNKPSVSNEITEQTTVADHQSMQPIQRSAKSGNIQDRVQTDHGDKGDEGDKSHLSILDHVAQGLDAFTNMLDQFAKQFEVESFTLEELLQKLEPSIDQDMIKTAQDQNLTALGGELFLMKEDSRMGHFKIDIKLYFIDQQKNYILREKTISPQLLILTKEAREDLIKNSPIKYPITAPNA